MSVVNLASIFGPIIMKLDSVRSCYYYFLCFRPSCRLVRRHCVGFVSLCMHASLEAFSHWLAVNFQLSSVIITFSALTLLGVRKPSDCKKTPVVPKGSVSGNLAKSRKRIHCERIVLSLTIDIYLFCVCSLASVIFCQHFLVAFVVSEIQ